MSSSISHLLAQSSRIAVLCGGLGVERMPSGCATYAAQPDGSEAM
jgi:hypothetical protein